MHWRRATRRRTVFVLLAVALPVLMAGSASGADALWQSRGPFGGTVSLLVVDQAHPGTIYAAGSEHGLFKTTNGGRSWRPLESRSGVEAVAVDPKAPSTVYLGTVRLYVGGGRTPQLFKSQDGGRTWRPSGAGLGGASIGEIAIDPLNPAVLYAGTTSDAVTYGSRGVFKSTDGGRRWRLASRGLGRDVEVEDLAINPVRTSTVYVATWDGVFRTTNGGGRWKPVSEGFGDVQVTDLAIDPRTPSTLYAVGGNVDDDISAVFKSTDAGETWRSITPRVDTNFGAVAVHPSIQHVVFVASGRGVFRSADGGRSWIAPSASVGLGDASVWALAVHPHLPTLYVGTKFRGAFKSVDSGRTWRPANRGLVARSIYAVAVDPRNALTVYAGTDGDGVFKSSDGGRSWDNGYPAGPAAIIETLSIDPRRPRTVYAGTWDGIFRSWNGGRSWQRASKGMERNHEAPRVLALAIDPLNPSIVYAGTEYRGLFKSVNGGRSWRPVNDGIDAKDVGEVAIDPRRPSTVWAGGWNGRLYKSTDAGESWRRVPIRFKGASSIAFDPQRPATLYIATWSGVVKSVDGGDSWRPTGLKGGGGSLVIDPRDSAVIYSLSRAGVARSRDGAENWQPFNRGLTSRYVMTLAIASSGGVLYAGTYDSGVFDYRLHD